MKKTAHHPEDAEGQMALTFQPTRAERLASGELRDLGAHAKPFAFGAPIAATRRLWADVEAVPTVYCRRETPARRWRDVLLLTAAAAVHAQQHALTATEVRVILHTTTAPEKSREHLKSLRLVIGRGDREEEAFTLGYREEV